MTIQRGVVPLGIVPKEATKPAPDQDMIDMLESLLQEAKDGQVACVAYAAVYHDETIRTAHAYPAGNAFTLLGAIERTKQRFYDRWCKTDEE